VLSKENVERESESWKSGGERNELVAMPLYSAHPGWPGWSAILGLGTQFVWEASPHGG